MVGSLEENLELLCITGVEDQLQVASMGVSNLGCPSNRLQVYMYKQVYMYVIKRTGVTKIAHSTCYLIGTLYTCCRHLSYVRTWIHRFTVT